MFNIFKKKKNKCDCGDPNCKMKIVSTNGGRLYKENMLTCGHIKKIIIEISEKYIK